ncbi:MAG: nitroreductase family protein [Emergencia sp.]
MSFVNDIVIDRNRCIGCGLCKKACPSMLLDLDEENKAFSEPVDRLNWYGCWKCQHCMAVCPAGAVSVFGLNPEDSLPAVSDFEKSGEIMDAIVAGRRSCRHYRQENVDRELLDHILKVMENTPTGGNKMFVEYTLIDDIDRMNRFRELLRSGYDQLKAEGRYPFSWDEDSLGIMEDREDQAMNGDMFFCSAPHLFIPHMPAKFPSAPVDVNLTMAYFELLCNAHGLGTVYLGFPINFLKMLPEIYELLEIPEDHYIGSAIGFGYPVFRYARGVQKEGNVKIHRLSFDE